MKRCSEVHVIPIDDTMEHDESPECVCLPILLDGVWTHHAKDCREKYERAGVGTGKSWVAVMLTWCDP